MSFASEAEKAARARQIALLEESLRITSETVDTGAATLSELHRQGEKLDRIEAKVEETEHMADQGSFILRGMKGFGGRIKNFFSGPPKRKADDERRAKGAALGGGAVAPPKVPDRMAHVSGSGSGGSSRGASGRAGGRRAAAPAHGRGDSVLGGMFEAHALPTAMASERDEHEVILDKLSENLGTLKEMGYAMGDELDRHNRKLDKVGEDVDRVNRKLRTLRFTADTIA